MIIVCTASSDTYITNKIIDGNFQATDANVGQAATLDIFKLYNETTLNGTSSQTELSRALVKFDLSPINNLTGTILDLKSSNFKATIEMKDIMTGHGVPRDFTLSVFPLSQSFDEGEGLDTGKFSDIHVSNFITSSYNAGNVLWYVSGANGGGLLGDDNLDYIESGTLDQLLVSFEKKQTFTQGTEDLSINVTNIVSATVAGQIPDMGFRLAFTGSQETDSKTRFVKRFASRHVSNPLLRPRLIVRFDDSIEDNHQNFTFDSTGSIFLNSYEKSKRANLVSGTSLSKISGNNCFVLELTKGLFSYSVTGSQHTAGTDSAGSTGLYSASFALASVDSGLYTKRDSISKLLRDEGEIEFTTYWKSLDYTVAYHTGTLTMKAPDRRAGEFSSREPQIIIKNAGRSYNKDDTARFSLFGRDLDAENNLPVKQPISLKSVIFDEVYYQVVDRITEKVVLSYDKTTNSTKVSTDANGMFFDFKMQALIPGRSYAFDFYIVDRGISYLVRNRDSIFEVKS
tara:strand:+ start:35082 stop:36620 length:1539 start_codon:yes stop_codon:yes gene_type:complete